MDQVTAGVLSNGLKIGANSGAAPAGPSQAYGGSLGTSGMFDGSGWNVNFGAGGIESSASKAGELSQYMPYIVVAVVGLLAWRALKR